VDLTDEDRELILATLFSLWLSRSTFDVDRDADQMPFAHIQRDAIVVPVVKLGGDQDEVFFGGVVKSDGDATGSFGASQRLLICVHQNGQSGALCRPIRESRSTSPAMSDARARTPDGELASSPP
jgi:hypothetical protein